MAQADAGADPSTALLRAESYAHTLVSRAPGDLAESEVIALGYFERLRLGLGSPFRLMEHALRDPELAPDEREVVALGLLAQTLRGEIYEVDPAVLEVVAMGGVPARVPIGARQLELIERTIGAAPTPESGERMVRLGYQLAKAERTVQGVRQSVVSHVAALVADRHRARADARALVRAAGKAGVSPLQILGPARRQLEFRVEAPALTPLSVREEEAVARQGPGVALALRALAQRLSAPASLVPAVPGPAPAEDRSLLAPGVAERLLQIAEQRNHPPQAPIAVAVLINGRSYVEQEGIDDEIRSAREAFVESAWNEERFVAGVRLQRTTGVAPRVRLSLIELQAAVFLRALNQEEPWFPGDPAPAAKDLVARFGLAGVEFGTGVPERWQPYYLLMLGRGLADLQRVLPTASVRGLTIRVDELPGERRALAMHDPRRRILYLPPRTGAGTLAHEIAHDLDLQLGRKRYGSRGGYATDLAVSAGRSDRIAYALKGLERSLTQPDSAGSAHDLRPAEVFARGTDWFVAAMMARERRTGGALTSFQDPVLTGFGTTRAPDVGGGAVPALLNLLEAVAPVVQGTREWALDQYGPHRMLSPGELAGGIIQAAKGADPFEQMERIDLVRDRTRQAVDNAVCRLSSAEGIRRLSAAQRSLVQAAATAAARGVAVDAARALAARNGVLEGSVDAWMTWQLYGAPEPADSLLAAVEPLLEEIVYRLREVEGRDPITLDAVGALPVTVPLCGGNPFAAGGGGRAASFRSPG